jgi:hypothetical protein
LVRLPTPSLEDRVDATSRRGRLEARIFEVVRYDTIGSGDLEAPPQILDITDIDANRANQRLHRDRSDRIREHDGAGEEPTVGEAQLRFDLDAGPAEGVAELGE